MNPDPKEQLRIFGNYQVLSVGILTPSWEVRGRYDKLVVSGCETEAEAVERAVDKVTRAYGLRQLQGLDTVWLF